MTSEQWRVLGRAALNPEEAATARELIATCDAHDGLRLKISVYTNQAGSSEAPNVFLVYDGATLAGCWSVDYDGGHEAETCGTVRPEYRRRGIGRALFSAACDALRQRGATSILLICEDSSPSGRAFVAAVHGTPRHKELHMERPAELPAAPSLREGVQVRPGTRADLDALVRILARAFSDDEAGVRRRVLSEVDDPTMPYLVITAGGEVVGALKPYELTGVIGLYAVGVLPERQRQGYGTQLMRGAMAWLGARFPDRPFALEVDPANAAARAVYTATGFAVTTTYGYYAV